MKGLFRTRKRWVPTALILAVAFLAAAFLVFKDEILGKKVDRLWAGLGVRKPNIILITLDTTRADHLGCYGYAGVRTPNLDALAARGAMFEQCTTSSPLTLPAHSTIMTGMYPTYHGVRVNGNTALSDEQTTLAEVFSGQGYRCGAFIGAFVLDGRWGLKQGFDHYDDQFDLKKYKQLDLGLVQRPGNQVMDAALSWLEGQKQNAFFAWIHLYDPHVPYDPPEPYRSLYGGRPAGPYDGEIAFMDEQVGRCLSWLADNGLDRRTIIIVVGDHGEGLGSHNEMTHGFYIYDSVAHVPLIIAAPFDRFRGLRLASQVGTVDVFATALELARLVPPQKSQGESLLPMLLGRARKAERYAYCESMAPNIQFGWASLHAIRTERYKFIEAPRLELYDLARDPAETTNVLDENAALARSLKATLDGIMAETSLGAPKPQSANLDKDTIQRLAALGYIGAPVAQKKAGGARQFLADPKDKLAVFEAVQNAGELIMSEKYDQAVGSLETALQAEPRIPQALLLLATCYGEMGRDKEAQDKLNLLLTDDPENIQALVSLANSFMKEGRTEDAIAVCKRTLSVDNRSVQAYMLLGEVYMAAEDEAQALPYLEKAVEIQPKLAQNNLNLAACLIGLKRYERAEALLVGVLRDSPKFPMAQFDLGLLYEEQGRWAGARKAYEAELAAYPRDFQSRFNLGKILLREGDTPGYLSAMREVISVAPKRAEGYLFLARGLLSQSGSLDEVQSLVEQGLALARTDELKALGYFLQADLYSRKNEPEKMRWALDKAKSFNPTKERSHET